MYGMRLKTKADRLSYLNSQFESLIKNGYKIHGIIKDAYGNQEDAIILFKQLKGVN